MKTYRFRLGLGLVLASMIGAVSGCASHSIQVQAKPSRVTFKIAFESDGAAKPTGMIINPNNGDAFLEVVKEAGPDDNKVVWKSDQNFRIRFVQIDDQTQPLKPGKELGNEKKDWNAASEKAGAWEYTLKLQQGRGSTKETVGAKYIVEHVDSGVLFDPVIIVGR